MTFGGSVGFRGRRKLDGGRRRGRGTSAVGSSLHRREESQFGTRFFGPADWLRLIATTRIRLGSAGVADARRALAALSLSLRICVTEVRLGPWLGLVRWTLEAASD